MAAIKINTEELNQLISAVKTYVDDTEDKFIKPCTEALRDCGLGGDFMKEIDPLADEVFSTLMSIKNQLGEETGSSDGSVLDALKSFTNEAEERVNSETFGGVGAKLADTQSNKVEISRKSRKTI